MKSLHVFFPTLHKKKLAGEWGKAYLSRMATPSTITIDTETVEFVSILEPSNGGLATWAVRFELDGREAEGDMLACPFHPQLLNTGKVENWEFTHATAEEMGSLPELEERDEVGEREDW